MDSGCYTALVTPYQSGRVDYENLEKLVDFQIENGITGIIAVGTTGESPVLNWDEHNKVTEVIINKTKGKCLCIAGTGSNNTAESMAGTEHAAKAGANGVLLVDPYYNGPSSVEIRREYVAPIAAAFPDLDIVPYVIPGRTGAQLLPEDLALLYKSHPNVSSVKEATANLANMRRTRECCGPEYMIFSGDDGMTYPMMTDPRIKAAGVISVVSNVAPRALSEMVRLLDQGNQPQAESLMLKLKPLFGLVTVKTIEQTPYGEVECRARNPLGLKTLMSLLGMPAGSCRQPLGKMTRKGLDKVIEIARNVYTDTPEILQPLGDYFNIDIADRLENPAYREGLYYESY
jgi:4-hydroxy-tetrahydrodipicolinate synthase